jgi:hypothetical protein
LPGAGRSARLTSGSTRGCAIRCNQLAAGATTTLAGAVAPTTTLSTTITSLSAALSPAKASSATTAFRGRLIGDNAGRVTIAALAKYLSAGVGRRWSTSVRGSRSWTRPRRRNAIDVAIGRVGQAAHPIVCRRPSAFYIRLTIAQ